MGIKKVGELDSWEDGDVGGGNDFMRLEQGSNRVRVFTKPIQFYICWVKDSTGKNRKIRSAVKDCPLVKRGEKPQARWYVGVLNRKLDGKPMILEIGPQIYKQIKGLSSKKDWGDPRGFDIDIERKPQGEQPLYAVAPLPHSAITDAEKTVIKDFKDRVDLVKMAEAPTPEEVLEMLGEAPRQNTSSAVSNDFEDFETTSPATATVDDDFDF